MAKPNRDLPKRKLAQCIKNINGSKLNLMQMHLLFDDGKHKDHAKLLEMIVVEHEVLLKHIEMFWKYAYGSVPERPDVYRR